jgi:hypothetical protein
MQRAMAHLSSAQRRAVDESLQSFTVDNLASVTRDLRAAADLRDFDAPDRTVWNPAVAPIRFQFPIATAAHDGMQYGL